jgi:hypothetical protein
MIGMVVITASLSNKLALIAGSWLEQIVIVVLHKKFITFLYEIGLR